MKRALVTGGAGFVGSHLVDALVARGVEVTVVDNLSTGHLSNLSAVSSRICFKRFDLADGTIEPLLEEGRFDTVFHAAANAYGPTSIDDPERDLRDNIIATHRLLMALRKAAPATRLVHLSTAAVYSEGLSGPMSEGDMTDPVSPYGVSKLAAEHYVTLSARLFGLKVVSIRLFSLFGPRLRKQVIWDFMNRIHADPTELVIHGDGLDERDLSHVANAVGFILVAAEKAGTAGEVYNFGSGESTSINDLAQALASAMGESPTLKHTNLHRPGDARRWVADTTRMNTLSFSPSISFVHGIADTVAWFRRRADNMEL